MSAVRAFVAVRLDEATGASLGAEIERLRGVVRDVAWVAPDNLHVTVKFLGEVAEALLGPAGDALAPVAAAAPPFDLVVDGLGAFPSAARARVVWAGTRDGSAALGRLAVAVDAALAPLGFAAEARPFTAHVTLGRVRVPRRVPALETALAAAPGGPYGTVRVERLSLMRSDLAPGGARYRELRRLPLAGPGVATP